jgi:hypothetical protein
MNEEWVEVQDFPGYSVNPLGQVKNDLSDRILHTRLNQYGVPYVGLMRDWRQCIRSLPRLVAQAYIPQPSEIFDTPINLNGDRTNCAVDNLMWRPRWYAVYYVAQFKDRYVHSIEASIRNIETQEVFENSLAAGCYYGILEREIVLSVLNKTPAWPTYQTFELANRE